MNTKDNLNYCLNIILCFCIVGVGIVLADSSQLVFGYTWISFSLIGALTILWALITPEIMNASWISVLTNVMTNSMPIVIIIVLLTWVMSMYLNYPAQFSNIDASGKSVSVPSLFYKYQFSTTLILIMQVIFIMDYIKDKYLGFQLATDERSVVGKTYRAVAKQRIGFIYILIAIQFILISNMNTILSKFMTEG